MFNWLRSLCSSPRSPSAPAARPGRFCPALEGLGDRVVPAVGAVAELVRGGAAVEAVTTLLRTERADETTGPAVAAGGDRFTEIGAAVPESTRDVVRQVRAETQDRLGEVVLTGRVAVRLAEVVRAAPVDIKWIAVQRFWLEARAFGPPGAPGHLLAAPPLPEVHLTGPASDAHVSHSPVPASHPHATDQQAAAAPRAHIEFWSIAVSDEGEPSERPEPTVAPPPPSSGPTGTPQPVASADQEPTAPAVVPHLDSAGVISRFLPFDTADLRKGVSDFLCGLEPALVLPDQAFSEWELGAALVVGTGVVMAVGKRGARTRAGERRPSAVSIFESLPTQVQ